MATTDTSCYSTTVQNVSGASRYFGYLGPRGLTLANNATVTFFGDIIDYISGIDRVEKFKAYSSFLHDSSHGILVVLRTPALILQDTASPFAAKQVILTSGTLGIHNPSYDTSIAP